MHTSQRKHPNRLCIGANIILEHHAHQIHIQLASCFSATNAAELLIYFKKSHLQGRLGLKKKYTLARSSRAAIR